MKSLLENAAVEQEDTEEDWFEIADFSTVTTFERLAANIEQGLRRWQECVPADARPRLELYWSEETYSLEWHSTTHELGLLPDLSPLPRVVALDDVEEKESKEPPLVAQWFGLAECLILRRPPKSVWPSTLWLGALVCACGAVKWNLPVLVAEDHPQYIGCKRAADGTTYYRSSRGTASAWPSDAHSVPTWRRYLRGLTSNPQSLEDGPSACRRTYALPVGVVPWEAVTGTAADSKECRPDWGTVVNPLQHLQCAVSETLGPGERTEEVAEPLSFLQVGIQWDVPGVLGEAIREFLDVGLHQRYTLEGHSVSALPPAAFLSARRRYAAAVATGHDTAGAFVLRVGTLLADRDGPPLSDEEAFERVRAIFTPALRGPSPPTTTPPSKCALQYSPTSLPAFLAYQAAQVVADRQETAARSLETIWTLWRKFVDTVRAFWEEGEVVPHVRPGIPDWDTCLLHQKLQMLNLCIVHPQPKQPSTVAVESTASDGWELDLGDDVTELIPTPEQPSAPPRLTPIADASGRQGAHREMKGAVLLRSGRPLWEPVTQPPLPLTEDSACQQQEVLAQLGTSEEARRLRIRLQTGTLKSDMEAFKAANPFDPCLADFLRWHSPKDFSAERLAEYDRLHPYSNAETPGPDPERETHCLSDRMRQPNTVWHRLWEEALALPVQAQTPLFDVVREAHVVIHYLEQLSLAEVLQLLADHWVVMAFATLATTPVAQHVASVRAELDRLAAAAAVSLDPTAGGFSIERYGAVCDLLDRAEVAASAAAGLLAALGVQPDSVPPAPIASAVSRAVGAEWGRAVPLGAGEWAAVRPLVAQRNPVREEWALAAPGHGARLYTSMGTDDGLLATTLTY